MPQHQTWPQPSRFLLDRCETPRLTCDPTHVAARAGGMMRRMHARLLLLPLVVTACSDPTPAPPPPPAVLVATPLAQQVLDWDDFSGRFEAVDTVEVRPRVGGTIESVHFTDGQRVT